MIKVILIFFLFPFIVLAQSKKYKAFSEHFKAVENTYMISNDWKSFFASGIANKTLEIEDVDQELLSATVFFTFNKMRAKKRRKVINYSKELYASANTYGNYYRSGSFKKRHGNIRKANKCVRYTSKKNEYFGAYQKVYLKQAKALNRKRNKAYYYDRKAEDGTGYYYGERRKASDSLKELKEVEPYTYTEFAEDLVMKWFRGSDSKFSKGKAYTEGACYVFIDKKNVKNRYIPYARVLFVIGGRRMLLLPDEEESS